MHYVFEDNRSSLLMRLYRHAYSSAVVENFHYACGNSKIAKYIEENFGEDEEITVFLDMPPGNPDIVYHYNKIGSLRVQYKKLLVYPLVCGEYYYLKFTKDKHVVSVPQWVDACLGFSPISSARPPILAEGEETKYTTYENFCKLVARKAMRQCARVGVLSKEESRDRPFFLVDCLCGTDLVYSRCTHWRSVDKSAEFVKQFPVHPAFGNRQNERLATWDERVDIHRKLVSNYNTISGTMGEKDVERKELYVKIDPLV